MAAGCIADAVGIAGGSLGAQAAKANVPVMALSKARRRTLPARWPRGETRERVLP